MLSQLWDMPCLIITLCETCHPQTHTSHLIEILIPTSNRFCPSEKEWETRLKQKAKKGKCTFNSKDGWFLQTWMCLLKGFTGRVIRVADSNPINILCFISCCSWMTPLPVDVFRLHILYCISMFYERKTNETIMDYAVLLCKLLNNARDMIIYRAKWMGSPKHYICFFFPLLWGIYRSTCFLCYIFKSVL